MHRRVQFPTGSGSPFYLAQNWFYFISIFLIKKIAYFRNIPKLRTTSLVPTPPHLQIIIPKNVDAIIILNFL